MMLTPLHMPCIPCHVGFQQLHRMKVRLPTGHGRFKLHLLMCYADLDRPRYLVATPQVLKMAQKAGMISRKSAFYNVLRAVRDDPDVDWKNHTWQLDMEACARLIQVSAGTCCQSLTCHVWVSVACALAIVVACVTVVVAAWAAATPASARTRRAGRRHQQVHKLREHEHDGS